jgi:hypothetical protein
LEDEKEIGFDLIRNPYNRSLRAIDFNQRDERKIVSKDSLKVTTIAGQEFVLHPVPMRMLPSRTPEVWLAFQGPHVPDSSLSEEMQSSIQRFMSSHKTEALKCGEDTYTLAGGMLAWCDPCAVDLAVMSQGL